MDHAPDLEVVADAALAAHAVIETHGTRTMKMLSRMLLFTIGKEIARRSRLPRTAVGPGRVDDE